MIRDRESKPLDDKKTVPIAEGGQVRHMNNQKLEAKFLESLPDLMITQKCIPEHLIDEDPEIILNDQLRQKLKKKFESDVQKELSKLTEAQVKKLRDSIEKQVMNEVKKTWEANALQKRQAENSEAIVQRAVIKAAQKQGVVLTVLRGINTFKDVATYLEDIGIQCSKLGGLSKSKDGSSRECEHDVAVIGINPAGIFVTFIQVNIFKYVKIYILILR